jgi:hypothetical protein
MVDDQWLHFDPEKANVMEAPGRNISERLAGVE